MNESTPRRLMARRLRIAALPWPASSTRTEMRVVDIYRRDGDRLAENWVFIDLLHYLLLLGVDVLERCRSIGRR